MSVILEGKVSIDPPHVENESSTNLTTVDTSIDNLSQEDNRSWNGCWKFAKDKRFVLDFSYQVFYVAHYN